MKALLKLLDVKTLVAGVIPVALGSVYSLYRFATFSLWHMLLLMLGIMLMQSSANMINDLYDYKRGADDASKAEEKALASKEISERQVEKIIAAFLTIDMGILLFYSITVNWSILLVGILGATIMYAYSAGKRPISYTCFGEITAGLTMGFGIMATVTYIQSGVIDIETVLVTIPTTLFIGTILLTNNLSDCADDRKSGRRTLPILIGVKLSEKLWMASCVGLLMLTGFFTYAGFWPLESLVFALVFFPYSSLTAFYELEKNVENKGRLMGLIGKIGMRYHFAVILGLVVSRYLGV